MTATAETLFTLTGDLRALDELLTESGGEVTPEALALMAEYQAKFSDKVDAVAWYARTLESELAAATTHAEHFEAKAVTARRKLDAWKSYLSMCLTSLGVDQVKGEAFTVALQNNGGKPPLEILEPFKSDPSILPPSFQLVHYEADTAALRAEANPEGEVVIKDRGGALCLAARVLPRGKHVRVK